MLDAVNKNYSDKLEDALSCFECCKDTDVQEFLRHKAISFETRGWATTYLLLSKSHFDNGELKIEGYFSLTHKAVIFDKSVSKTTRNTITGSKSSETVSFVLIGQLGKYMSYSEKGIVSSSLTAVDLLNDAINIIMLSSEYIINRNVIVECKPIEKVKKIYEDYGFSELQYDENENLYMLYLKLQNSISFWK